MFIKGEGEADPEVCPEHITITDTATIPLKEHMATRYYDPIAMAWRWIPGEGKEKAKAE